MNVLKSQSESLKLFFKNKEHLFVFFVVSAIIGVGISYSNFYMFHLALIIYMFFYIWIVPLKNFPENYLLSKYPSRLHYFLIFSIIWYALMIFISENKLYGITHLVYLIIGSIIVFVIVQRVKNAEILVTLFKALAIVVFVEIFISFLESIEVFRWPISRLSDNVIYFGRANEIYGILKESVSACYVNTMPTGFHWNPNDLAVLLSIAFPFFLFYSKKWIAIFGNVIIIWIIIQCGARIVLVSCFIMVLISFLFINKRNYIVHLVIFITILFCSSNGFSLLNGKYPKFNEIQSFTYGLLGVKQPIYGVINEDLKKGSIALRKELIKFGINSSVAHYGLGVGGGNSRHELEKIGGMGEKKIVNLHNFWVEILMEGGAIYLLSFIVWYCMMLWKLFKASRTVKEKQLNYFSKSLFVALCGYIISAITPSAVIYFLPMYVLFAFAISTINICKLNNNINDAL